MGPINTIFPLFPALVVQQVGEVGPPEVEPLPADGAQVDLAAVGALEVLLKTFGKVGLAADQTSDPGNKDT